MIGYLVADMSNIANASILVFEKKLFHLDMLVEYVSLFRFILFGCLSYDNTVCYAGLCYCT